MIAERIQQNHTNTRYYQTILEHVIDCFQTIVCDEKNPYHPQLTWFSRKQSKRPDDELFADLMDECSLGANEPQKRHHANKTPYYNSGYGNTNRQTPAGSNCNIYSPSLAAKTRMNCNNVQLSSSVRSRLERYSKELRKEIVSRERDGCSPLFSACQNGLTKVVRFLIDICDANIEQRGRYETFEDQHVHSVPPIWVAAVSGHYDTVKLLIDRHANVNSISDTGSTPLRSACFMIKYDDGINSPSLSAKRRHRNTEATVSSAASSSQPADVFSFEQQSDSDHSDDEEMNDCHRDCDPYMSIVKLLVENGADLRRPNYNGGTCLVNALSNYTLTEYIISKGADIDAADNIGRTALHHAISENKTNVTKLLLARGANPMLKTNFCDDALQLSCIGGNEEIFNQLIENYSYNPERVSDAYKLLGATVLEMHYDISRVRSLWSKSIELKEQAENLGSCSRRDYDVSASSSDQTINRAAYESYTETTLRRRQLAYEGSSEFQSMRELDHLSAENFRTQSLLISERILGSTHRETIQRILYQGTPHINSMRPDRCVDLWIYALNLLLDRYSIFNYEVLLAARAIKKLLLDLISQQPQFIRFDDVHDVLDALISHGRLEKCVHLLNIRPRYYLHEDIFDRLLWIIVNLLLLSRCVAKNDEDKLKIEKIVSEIARVNPRTVDGSSILHVCASSSLFESEAYRSIVQLMSRSRQPNATVSPVAELVEQFLDAGLFVDQIKENKVSVLHAFCLASASIRSPEKHKIIKLLVERGAHVDRHIETIEQSESIIIALRDSNVAQPIRLSCLAARQLSKLIASRRKVTTDSQTSNAIRSSLTKGLYEFVKIH